MHLQIPGSANGGAIVTVLLQLKLCYFSNVSTSRAILYGIFCYAVNNFFSVLLIAKPKLAAEMAIISHYSIIEACLI